MQNYSGRRDDLPDYKAPPINEVVLGVQFEPLPGYHLAHLTEVWNLYRGEYSLVEYQPPLPPTFETFGPHPRHPGGISFQFGQGPEHPRCWFITPNGHELFQFQPTRLLFNWRQVEGKGGEYPRYEAVRARFSDGLDALNEYSREVFGHALQINQCEVTYINRIYGANPKEVPNAADWLSFLRFGETQIEGYGGGFTEVLRSNDRAYGRLFTNVNSAVDSRGHAMIVVELTVRGLPDSGQINRALEFMDRGRDVIVESFTKITTNYAHENWGRVK